MTINAEAKGKKINRKGKEGLRKGIESDDIEPSYSYVETKSKKINRRGIEELSTG